MKEATKRAASEVLAQMMAVTAMLVIASVVLYWRGGRAKRSNPENSKTKKLDCFVASAPRNDISTHSRSCKIRN